MEDNNKYDAYQYGNASESQSGETENTQTDIEQEAVSYDTVEEPAEVESTEVNFIMYNPESEAKEEQGAEEYREVEILEEKYSEPQKTEYKETYEEVKPEREAYSDTKKKKERKSSKMKKWMTCISMAIIFGIVASVVFQASNRFIDSVLGTEEKETEKVVNTTNISATADVQVLSDVSEVAANVMPSVVSITCLTVQEVQSYFFGGGYTQQYESSGSGIIIGQNDTELLIVTNNHVVEGSSTVTVTFADDASIEAQIKGTDANIDVAIVAVALDDIEEDTLNAIKIANLGDSNELVVGEPTIAIGNALGYGQSVTTGIVSALNRTIDDFETELIQTDAAINPGNSGGALLNAAGEVIGINTAKVSDDAVEGMGYAIPISDIQEVLSELMNKETRLKVDEEKRGTIGIQGKTVSESAQQYNIPQGVYVDAIVEGGAAEKAGMKEGCIITEFDGTSITSMDELQNLLEYYEAGEKVEIVVKETENGRKYTEKTYEITLGKQSDLN